MTTALALRAPPWSHPGGRRHKFEPGGKRLRFFSFANFSVQVSSDTLRLTELKQFDLLTSEFADYFRAFFVAGFFFVGTVPAWLGAGIVFDVALLDFVESVM